MSKQVLQITQAKQNGLTMIEVLVAMAIFSTTVVLALASLQFQLQRQDTISKRHAAAHLANNIALDLQLEARNWPKATQYYPATPPTNWSVTYTPLPTSKITNEQALERLRIDIKSENKVINTQEAYRIVNLTERKF